MPTGPFGDYFTHIRKTGLQGDTIRLLPAHLKHLPALLLVVFTAALISSGCYTYQYYEAPERVHFTHGELFFSCAEVDGTLLSLQSPKYWHDPRYLEWVQARYGTDTSAYYDKSMLYRGLRVLFKPDSRITGGVEMTADSVMVFYIPPFQPEAYDGLEPAVREAWSGVWVLSLEPIVIPKTYRADFWVDFVLTISHGPEEPFVERRRLSVHCIYGEKKWTPLFPGR